MEFLRKVTYNNVTFKLTTRPALYPICDPIKGFQHVRGCMFHLNATSLVLILKCYSVTTWQFYAAIVFTAVVFSVTLKYLL